MKSTKIILISTLFFLAGCAQNSGPGPIPQKVVDTFQNLGCGDLESRLWDAHASELRLYNQVPTYDKLESRIVPELENSLNRANVPAGQRDDAIAAYKALLSFLTIEVPKNTGSTTVDDWTADWTAIEIGDRSTAVYSVLQDKYKLLYEKLNSLIQTFSLSCDLFPEERQVGPNPQQSQIIKSGLSLPSWGARKALATAYQSCQSLDLAPMTISTPDVQGVSHIGKHSDGIGYIRAITSLSSVQKTHYYIKDFAPAPGCFNVKASPLIYDYGGKPYYPSDQETLNFFKNAGSGGAPLGMDCSGYIYSAISSAGLKIDPNKAIKARYVSSIPARMFMNPKTNGMACFDKAGFTTTDSLRNGDILAISGHVLMIEKVGADPLGIKKALAAGTCSSITSDQFDFTIAQSAPIKGDIGISRAVGRDYLKASYTMRTRLEQLAQKICNAKGTAVSQTATDFSVVRHNGSTQCIEAPLPLAYESCISSCQELTN